MQKTELIERNPLRILYPAAHHGPVSPRMGLVMARPGLGKTSILVQIALDSLLCGNSVLHVSIGQKLEKTKAWYDDIFRDIADTYHLENAGEILEEINKKRIIMTFQEASFSRPKLEERLNDLIYQNIFIPDCLVIDGFDFEKADQSALSDIRELMGTMELMVWFSAVNHRGDNRKSESGVPAPCHEIDHLFDTVILLQAEKDEKCIALKMLKDVIADGTSGKKLKLDPATLMLVEPYDRRC